MAETAFPLEAVGQSALRRGQVVWTRRMDWGLRSGPDIDYRFGRPVVALGQPRELEVRPAIRVWCCMGCGVPIPRGTLHGSSIGEHWCGDCVTPARPPDQWRPVIR